MKSFVVRGIKNLINNESPRLKNLYISYFGGEPLLNHEVMIDISSHAASLSKRFGFIYRSHVTTNATLLDLCLFKKLLSCGVTDFQITLDGDSDIHDTTRVGVKGIGTFNTIWNNLNLYKNVDEWFTVLIRLHLTKFNYHSVLNLSQKIVSTFGSDKRYVADVELVNDLGAGVGTASGRHYSSDSVSSKDQISNIRNVLGKKVDPVVSYFSHKNPKICYAAMPRQLLIRPNGRLGKCTVKLYDKINDIGKINEDGTLEINDKLRNEWTRGFRSLKNLEMSCPAVDIKPKIDEIKILNLS